MSLFNFEQITKEKMMLKRTDIERRLQLARSRDWGATTLSHLLKDLQIEPHKERQQADLPVNSFDFDRLDPNRIYHLRHIRQICIDYRLRFLDLAFFKPALPEEAHAAIDQLGETHHTRLEQFKIVAPSRLFKLEDQDDPLLFVPMGNDYFYLVHKWGKDLHPFRRWLVWPFKSLPNLVLLLFLVSYLATLLIPGGLFSRHESTAQFLILFFFTFKSLVAVALFYGIALGKNFNPAIWDSKYYNA